MLKYHENGLDRAIRLAREDEAKKLNAIFTDDVIEDIVNDITNKMINDEYGKITVRVKDYIACYLLRADYDINYVHRATGVPISRIEELKSPFDFSIKLFFLNIFLNSSFLLLKH